MQACDFSRSYLWFRIDLNEQVVTTMSHNPTHTVNNVRIPLECVCDMTPHGGQPVQYVLAASCKTERTNVPGDIWFQPNADFCPVLSREHFLIIKRYDHTGRKVMFYPPSQGEQPHRQSGLIAGAYTKTNIDVRRVDADVLDTVEQVVEIGLADRPMVAVTEFDTDDGYHVRLEYPVKTINLGDREVFYQTDTGPVLYPQNPGGCDIPIESFCLAFIAANSPDWAEFLLNVPTPIPGDLTTDHYSQPIRITCKNTMLALR